MAGSGILQTDRFFDQFLGLVPPSYLQPNIDKPVSASKNVKPKIHTKQQHANNQPVATSKTQARKLKKAAATTGASGAAKGGKSGGAKAAPAAAFDPANYKVNAKSSAKLKREPEPADDDADDDDDDDDDEAMHAAAPAAAPAPTKSNSPAIGQTLRRNGSAATSKPSAAATIIDADGDDGDDAPNRKNSASAGNSADSGDEAESSLESAAMRVLRERLHQRIDQMKSKRKADADLDSDAAAGGDGDADAEDADGASGGRAAKKLKKEQQKAAAKRDKSQKIKALKAESKAAAAAAAAGGDDSDGDDGGGSEDDNPAAARRARSAAGAGGAASRIAETENFTFGAVQLGTATAVELYDENRKKKKVPKPVQLAKVEARQSAIDALKAEGAYDEAEALTSKHAFRAAELRAAGVTVKDDPKLLKRSIKKADAAKQKSRAAWGERTSRANKEKSEKQSKRTENIKNKATRNRPGFEGKNKSKFLNS